MVRRHAQPFLTIVEADPQHGAGMDSDDMESAYDQSRHRCPRRQPNGLEQDQGRDGRRNGLRDDEEAMERGERIELRGFGVFQIKPRKTGIGRNPRTGEEVRIPPGKAVRFKPGKELRALERKPSHSPESADLF